MKMLSAKSSSTLMRRLALRVERSNDIGAWKTLLLLANHTGNHGAVNRLVERSGVISPSELNAQDLTTLVTHLALWNPPQNLKDPPERLRLSCLARAGQLMSSCQGEDRRNKRLALARAWSLHRDKAAAEDVVNHLCDEPDQSRKLFSSISVTGLTDVLYLVDSMNKVGRGFHKYYLFFKVYEMAPRIRDQDMAMVFHALVKHNITPLKRHPTFLKFSRSMLARLVDIAGTDTLDWDAVERMFLFFDFGPSLGYPREALLTLQDRLLLRREGDLPPLPVLLWMGHSASGLLSTSPALVAALERACRDGPPLLRGPIDCALATSIIASGWVSETAKAGLAKAVNLRLGSLLEDSSSRLFSPPLAVLVVRCALVLTLLGNADRRVLAALYRHPRLTEPLPTCGREDQAGNCVRRFRADLKFAPDRERMILRDMLSQLFDLVRIKVPDYQGPHIFAQGDEDDESWKGSPDLQSARQLFHDYLSDAGVEFRQQSSFPKLGVREFVLLGLRGKGAAAVVAVLFDSSDYERGFYRFKDFASALLEGYGRMGLDPCLVDCKNASVQELRNGLIEALAKAGLTRTNTTSISSIK